MLAYIEILRPTVLLLAALATLTGALLVGFTSPQIILAMFITTLIGGAGNILNDYFDYDVDKVNRPKRPLPSGRMKREHALYYSGILFAIGIALSFFLNSSIILLVVFNSFLELLYSWKLKAVTLVGNFIPSWLAASAFLMGAFLSGTITALILLVSSMAFFANTGREIAKTIEDLKGDRAKGFRTLPVMFGEKAAAFISMLFFIFAIVLSTLPYVLKLLNIWYLFLIMIVDLLFASSCFLLFTVPSRAQRLMKVAMLLSIISFLIGIL